MRLRKLKPEDASLMLEWMHDQEVVAYMKTNFKEKTISDCEKFIISSQNDKNNLHMAVVDKNDVYMGTVSLKNIIDGTAEFAITVRACAFGKGYSRYAMAEIIRIGFEEKGLSQIYWYVSSENKRAIRFYEKNGCQRVKQRDSEQNASVIWYRQTPEDH